MFTDLYFDQAIETLRRIATEQKAHMERAASRLVDAIVDGHAIYAFGASHSFMIAEEMVYRTGGLMLVNPVYPHGMNLMVRPLTATSQLERLPGLGAALLESVPLKDDDVCIIASTSGRNAVAMDVAIEAAARGASTIGITSLDYTEAVSSRHPSGKKLKDVCDIVLDNGAPAGDAAVAFEGFAQKVGPLSSVTGCAVVNALVVETVGRLLEKGYTPPVFISANLDEGDAHNQRLLADNAHRIHYMF